MTSLADVLAAVMPVESLDDGALTIAHDGTFASLRPVAPTFEDLFLSRLHREHAA